MVYILDSMEELKMRLLSDDYGKHLLGVEDLLQKHSLVEADINVLGERVKQVVQQVMNSVYTKSPRFLSLFFCDESVEKVTKMRNTMLVFLLQRLLPISVRKNGPVCVFFANT